MARYFCHECQQHYDNDTCLATVSPIDSNGPLVCEICADEIEQRIERAEAEYEEALMIVLQEES